MPGAPIQTCTSPSKRTGAGPYRLSPPADPAWRAQVDEALGAARSEMRSARRARRWSTWLATSGYIAAAFLTSAPGGDEAGGAAISVFWAPVAAGATCALVRAGRAGARTHDLEAEIEDLERLSSTLARTPG
jgi:hypothetical protein